MADDEYQRALRIVTDEIEVLMAARGVGGVVLLVSPEAAAWKHVVPPWAAIRMHPKGLVIEIRGSTPAGHERTEQTMHLLGTLRDMGGDVVNMYGRLFRLARSQIELMGGAVEHLAHGGGVGTGGKGDNGRLNPFADDEEQ